MEGTKPKKTRPKPTRVRKLPEALEAELNRIAAEILEERSAEARRVAALEITNKLLSRVADLLVVAAGPNAPSAASTVGRKLAPQPKILNPCCMCGREGAYQDKTGKGGKPWYCAAHAALAVQSAREEARGFGLAAALTNAEPINEASLPE